MKLNYYMRGLGIGIVVTALLMGISLSGKKEEMTDEQIRQRAMEMGMVDGNVVLSEMPEAGEETEGGGGDETEDGEETEDEGGDEGLSDTLSGNHNETGAGEPVNDDDGARIPENSQEGQETVNEIVTIAIENGDGSRVVANKLLQAGLIDDAAAYDEYLCQNGHDKKLKTGRHDIPANANDEEIAAAITQKGY